MQGSRSDEMRSETALYLCARLVVLVKGVGGRGLVLSLSLPDLPWPGLEYSSQEIALTEPIIFSTGVCMIISTLKNLVYFHIWLMY